jgi:hypothetical protein
MEEGTQWGERGEENHGKMDCEEEEEEEEKESHGGMEWENDPGLRREGGSILEPPGTRACSTCKQQPPSPSAFRRKPEQCIFHCRDEYSLKSYNKDLRLHFRGIRGINNP